MIVLHFSMKGKDTIEHTNGKCGCFHLSMQKEDILEQTNAKCHLYTLVRALVDHYAT